MNYLLLQRVLNIIKLQLWHKSKRRICIRCYMICCDKCNKEYISEFDGYLCLRVFFEKKGYNCSRNIVPNLKRLLLSYCLNNLELKLVINVLKKYYDIKIIENIKQLEIKSLKYNQ